MHYIQQSILKKLLFSKSLKYSAMKPVDMEGSQFTFHLEQLIRENLVEKLDSGKYSLTLAGKNTANSIDFDSSSPNIQAKHSAVFCATRNDLSEVLIYTRLKNPFYGHKGFPTGKVQYGERIIDTAVREFTEETNLVGKPYLVGIRHYRVYFPKDILVEDKVMYVHRIDEPRGELKSNQEGEFEWIKVSEAGKVTNPLPESKEFLDLVLNFNGNISFKEIDHYPSVF